MRTHDRVNDEVWSTSKVLENLQRSRENLRDLPSGSAQEDHGGSSAACGSFFCTVIEWVEDQDNVITNNARETTFRSAG